MSLKQFKKLVANNKRDTSQLKRGEGVEDSSIKLGKELAGYNSTHVMMLFPPSKYKGRGAPFTKKVLNTSLGDFQDKSISTNGIRSAWKQGDVYGFQWLAKPGSGLSGKQYVNEASRKHIGVLFKMMTGSKKQDVDQADKQIGAHVESSAMLSILRKSVDKKIISKQEAQMYQKAFEEGNLEKVLQTDVGESKVGQGDIDIKVINEAFGQEYKMIKAVSENDTDFNVHTEVMIPLPHGINKRQAIEYENPVIAMLKAEVENLADIKLVDDPTSPSLISMYQEIIAAKLLGKTAPKYRVNEKFGNKKGKRSVRKSKAKAHNKADQRAKSQVERTKLHATLRNTKGQFSSPTALVALLNKKMPNKLMDIMGHPSLENITGRFATSVRVLKINTGAGNNKIPVIQYTYDREPYGVFEMGGRGDSRWATKARDPRMIIEDSIRAIAREMMINRFATQRL